MDKNKTSPGERRARNPATGAGPGGSAGECPVDHRAGTSTAPVMPATALPGSRMPAVFQLLNYWVRPQQFMERRRQRYGSRFQVSIRLPPRPVYVLTHPHDVKAMFMAPADVLHTGKGSATIEKYTGQSGLAWLDENEHKTRRRLLMPSFHGPALERVSTAITEMAKDDIAKWPRGQAIPLHPHIHRFTLHVIREVIYGRQTPECWEELLSILQEMMLFNNSMASPMLIHNMSPRMFKILRTIRPTGLDRFLKLRDQADQLVIDTIRGHRASGYGGDDLLSVLLGITHEDGSTLSEAEIRDEMMTIFLAGTETTAAAIAWSLVYLSRDDRVRERLLAELDAGEHDSYLTAVVNEVLRLRPSIPQIIVREVKKPIEIGDVRYEPGQHLLASAFLMNRDTSLYDDPDEFRPERFLNNKPGTYTWIPFGGGRIRCLGDKIGVVEMKTMIRELLTQCELVAPDRRPESARSRIVVNVPSDFARMELRNRVREVALIRKSQRNQAGDSVRAEPGHSAGRSVGEGRRRSQAAGSRVTL